MTTYLCPWWYNQCTIKLECGKVKRHVKRTEWKIEASSYNCWKIFFQKSMASASFMWILSHSIILFCKGMNESNSTWFLLLMSLVILLNAVWLLRELLKWLDPLPIIGENLILALGSISFSVSSMYLNRSGNLWIIIDTNFVHYEIEREEKVTRQFLIG